jgi:proteasome regulatory subunit
MEIGARVALNQQTFSIVEVITSEKDPLVSGMEIEEKPDITYDKIGGLKEQIRETIETVELPLKNPEIFEKVGITPPKGVLFYGPPGTGKTLLAKAVAHETNATFIKIVASEFVKKYIGEGSRLVRGVFELAKEKAPAIIFIDEIDAIAAKRLQGSTSGDREVQRTLMQLLAEMDGFEDSNTFVILATNYPNQIDPAVIRPGRIDLRIEIGRPNVEDAKDIFDLYLRKTKCSSNSLSKIAAKRLFDSPFAKGASGALIKNIVERASLSAVKRAVDGTNDGVTEQDIIVAIEEL